MTQTEATDAHVGIRLNRIHSNNQPRNVATTTDSTTTAAASDGNVYVTAAVFANNGYVVAAPAVINDNSAVERELITQPLPLSSNTLPGLRESSQPVVHIHRWAGSR
jgi:hypothetical protein